jgi:hypothetical protein
LRILTAIGTAIAHPAALESAILVVRTGEPDGPPDPYDWPSVHSRVVGCGAGWSC